MITKKRLSRWVLPAGAVLLGFAYYLSFIRLQSLESETHRMVDCWNKGDWACVASFASDSELKGYSISRNQAKDFLRDYCSESLVGGRKLTRITFQNESMALMFTATDDTGSARISGLVVRNNRHAQSPNLLTGLLLTSAQKKYGSVGGTNSVTKDFTAFLRQATEDKVLLENLGIFGILRTSEITDWPTWARKCQITIDNQTLKKKVTP